MLNALLKRFNQHRKEKYFQSPLFHTQKEYAFVGFGMHSMTALYPILRHFNIRLKYVCTRNSDWTKQLSPLFPGCSFIHDLNVIVTDPAIAGVFVCTTPEAHYPILTRLLTAGKPVFVEKPPCQSRTELDNLLKINPAAICKIGLQRRHWPGNKPILKKCKRATSYLYQFQTGPFPQGDPFTELFIHPLDYTRFLFGAPRLESYSKHHDDQGITVQLHLQHSGGCSGLLHLSTHYTWNPPLESLTIYGPDESLTLQYPTSVTGQQMPSRIMNIPAERLMNRPLVTREYWSGIPTLTPAMETTTWYTQGFLEEIEDFVTRVEDPRATPVNRADDNDLASLLPIYELFQSLAR